MPPPLRPRPGPNGSFTLTPELEQFADNLRDMSDEEFAAFRLSPGEDTSVEEIAEVMRQCVVRSHSFGSAARRAFTKLADSGSSGAKLAEWTILYPATDVFPPIEEFEKLTKVQADIVLGEWAEIQHTIANLGPLIRKRWTEVTTDKRMDLLLDAWPIIALTHRPELDVMFDNEQAFDKNPFLRFAAFNSGPFMVPQINLEDLVSANALPIFLETRSKQHPHAFAATGLLHAPLAKWKESSLWQKLDGYSTTFDSQTNLTPYASVIKRVNQSDARKMARTQAAHHPATGVQILRI